MSNWVDKYKKFVVSSHKRYVIVADLDGLFDYEELVESFENDGYKILIGKTDLAVRIHFELLVKDSGKKYLIVAPGGYRPLPDIESEVNFQPIGLSNLFPNLDAKAIKGLSFNALCRLSIINLYEELSHEKTLKFLLENLYEVDFETLSKSKAKERILNALITVLFEKNGINQPLTNFLINLSKPYFPELVTRGLTKVRLTEFLQNQWGNFVNNEIILFDFKDSLISKNLGYLFVFEYLKPIKVTPEKYANFPKQLKIGVFVDEQGNSDDELENLIAFLRQQLDVIEDIADQWFKIIPILANAKLKSITTTNQELSDDYTEVERAINNRFQRFIDNNYRSLFSLSGIRKPVVVSRILEHINAKPEKRKVLLVIDGMNYWQWTMLGRALTNKGLKFTSNASLAYIPTITAWSRQSIFRGDKPDLYADNSKENELFESYWLQHGLASYQIAFKKFCVNEPLQISNISSDITMLGLVCNDLDNIMHGAILGNEQLETTTQQWIEKSDIVSTILQLKALGFNIYITADHGNIEATGIKNLTLKEKIGALSRGKRHLHFTNGTLMENFLAQNQSLIVGTIGLSVYLRNQEAFTAEKTLVITHGGSHFWEVMVPFIEINE